MRSTCGRSLASASAPEFEAWLVRAGVFEGADHIRPREQLSSVFRPALARIA